MQEIRQIDAIKFRLMFPDGVILDFEEKKDMLAHIAWLCSGYQEVNVRIVNVRRARKEREKTGKMPAIRNGER